MFPIRDDIPSRETPYVNYALIAACVVAFLMQISRPDGEPTLVEEYGMIPARVLHPNQAVEIPDVQTPKDGRGQQGKPEIIMREAAPSAVPAWMTLLTCIFLHGGWMHLLGNIWFLYIFGDNVEDCYGHLGYLVFYLACGVAASGTHLLLNANSAIPTIGASGAIAGVMGAYFLLYPHSRVLAVLPLFVIFYTLTVPAPVFLGIWFLIQLVQSVGSINNVEAAGVAFWAHVGGFVAGLAATYGLKASSMLRQCVSERLPESTGRVSFPTSRGRRSSGQADPFADDDFFSNRR
ncbi:rhomboid family intramembrane serine protease [Thalassoroseus pseudoceratinae]|uniref:rhomboid family intramembrane serine protease n=1 Tax=Thalassoroseus pseudoceratinae TaxID=2713176 RepID=UPI00141DD342|nr:rhomboid family intramembrane serine protease [Thalassoroseus pseudoceratinae]